LVTSKKGWLIPIINLGPLTVIKALAMLPTARSLELFGQRSNARLMAMIMLDVSKIKKLESSLSILGMVSLLRHVMIRQLNWATTISPFNMEVGARMAGTLCTTSLDQLIIARMGLEEVTLMMSIR
jgi:hypothetical protein